MILATIPDARLCSDPRMGDANGKPVANIRVATNFRKKGDDGEWTDGAIFLDVALWRGAETVEAYFRKGSPIIVHGEIREREWTDRDGGVHTGLELANADWAFPPKNDGGAEQAQKPAPRAPAQTQPAADDDIPF